ncbi:MAG: PaaI family thioesterase [Acholeplasmataceae bacterium]|nr:MAG: PaaI family thioesterase [Acholeplasmataceae bacterium]
MLVHIVNKQPNARMCFVCGTHNDLGLKARFYELENAQLLGVFKGLDAHQGYPAHMHGGIIVALLDEVIARAIQIHEPDNWGITSDLSVRYVKPVPLDQTLMVVGKVTRNRRRLFEGEAYMIDESQNILAMVTARYIKRKADEVFADAAKVDEHWLSLADDDDLKSVELPL